MKKKRLFLAALLLSFCLLAACQNGEIPSSSENVSVPVSGSEPAQGENPPDPAEPTPNPSTPWEPSMQDPAVQPETYSEGQLEKIMEEIQESEIAPCITGVEISTDGQVLITATGAENIGKIEDFLKTYPQRDAVSILELAPTPPGENPTV